jgi:hypothetical protein
MIRKLAVLFPTEFPAYIQSDRRICTALDRTLSHRRRGGTSMQMTIQHKSGLRVDAVLLAANRERMRVAIPSERDTIELTKVDGCWLTETGEQVEIEALFPIDGVDVSQFCAAIYPRSMTAGCAPDFD